MNACSYNACRNATLWNDCSWTYSTSFTVDMETLKGGAGSEVVLVFDGIKMGANISLNGQQIGENEERVGMIEEG